MNGYDFELNNQGYHLESDVGCYCSGRQMGRAEREEEFRAQIIDLVCKQRQKIEKKKKDEED